MQALWHFRARPEPPNTTAVQVQQGKEKKGIRIKRQKKLALLTDTRIVYLKNL